MYKLKNIYIDRMISSRTSSAEIDFILYIAKYQDDYGRVESVYYKDVCSALSISIQKFYDILKSLQKKKLLEYQKVNRADILVQLIGNDFSNQDFSGGYLKVATTDFNNRKFRSMKAGSKLLYLYMQRFGKGKHMLVKNFYERFSEIFSVSAKSLQIYLHELKSNFFLFISKKRNKACNYEMTMKLSTVLAVKNYIVPTERDLYMQNIADLVERNFKKQLPEENAPGCLWDIAALAVTQKAQRHKNYIPLLITAIKNSIKKQQTEKKRKIVLNAALINSCLSDVLERDEMKRYGLI